MHRQEEEKVGDEQAAETGENLYHQVLTIEDCELCSLLTLIPLKLMHVRLRHLF